MQTHRFVLVFTAVLLCLSGCSIVYPATIEVNPPTVVRITGADMVPCKQYEVCGTDLGIPFRVSNRATGFLFGDTFAARNPEDTTYSAWRSPIMLRSSTIPTRNSAITFDSAAGIVGKGFAPAIMHNGKWHDGEASVIPNDGISFNEPDAPYRAIVSFQSVTDWHPPDNPWQTRYAGLAVSWNGETFDRIGPDWNNPADNSSPFQMVSMQRDGKYVYLISVKSGRQQGPMLLQRVPWRQMLNQAAYQCWNGSSWGGQCQSLFDGVIGEPSLRRLNDGTWAMAYQDVAHKVIVTRHAAAPQGPWSNPKIQVRLSNWPLAYGGFIHPDSSPDNLVLLVSTWQRDLQGRTTRYDVSQVTSSL